MARSEARLTVDIWKDRDFLAQDSDAQRLYMLLISQNDMTHLGTIPLRIRRWAKLAPDTTAEGIEAALRKLETARFVIVDWDAEELLVRSFLRGDKVYRQPQILAAAAEQLALLTSLLLRDALAVELRRILTLPMGDSCRPLLTAMLANLAEARTAESDEPAAHDPHEQGAEQGPGRPLGVRGVTTDPATVIPLPLSPEPPTPHTPPLAALAEREPNSRPKREIDEAWARFWDVYPRKVSKGTAERVFRRMAKDPKVNLEAVIAGATAYRDDSARQRGGTQYTAFPATWLNGQRWLDEQPKPGTTPAPAGLQERDGLMLGPANIAAADRRERMAALQAQRDAEQLPAIEGSTR